MKRRGSSLIEVMVASSILIVGLVGVVELLIQGAHNQRRGVQPVMASLSAQQVLTDYTMLGYPSLVAGTFDGGTRYDGAGRKFTQVVTVDPDAGVGYPAFLVTVRIESDQPGLPTPLVTTVSTILSRSPDGG